MDFVNDLRLSLRALTRRPVYAAVSVGVLALGLAASSTAFNFVNSFYQKIPGATAGDRLSTVYFVGQDTGWTARVSYPDFLDYAAEADVLDGLAGLGEAAVSGILERPGEHRGDTVEWIWGRSVTSAFFSVLGVEMSAGRGLSPDADEVAECVLSHAFWQRSFGGDPAVIGKTVTLNRRALQIVGVASPEFRTIYEGFHPDLWISLGSQKALDETWRERTAQRDRASIVMYARLKPGVTEEEAAASFDVIHERLRQTYRRAEEPSQAHVLPKTRVSDWEAGKRRTVFLAMLAGAGVLLLLACVNVANVLLAVALGRRRELGVRAALGAGPGRLLRLLLTENLVLTVLGGALGALLAGPATRWLLTTYYTSAGATSLLTVWASPETTLDFRFFGFTVLVALVAGLGSGLLPAWRAARRDLVPALKDSGEAPRHGGLLRLEGRELMVAVQVALSSTLLICAALMWRSFGHLTDLDPGFDRHGLLTAMVSLEGREMTPQERLSYLDGLVGRLAAEPGVTAAAVSRGVPFATEAFGRVEVEGQEEPLFVDLWAVGPGYFTTLELPVLRGRALDERDSATASGAVLVNEELVRRYFKDRDPVGQRLSLADGEPGPEGGDERDFRIVGVVGSMGLGELARPRPEVYFSLAQRGHSPAGRFLSPGFGLLVRTAAPPSWLYEALRVQAGDLAVMNVVPMAELVEGTCGGQLSNAWYFSALALLGLALSAAGLWSVLNVAVRRRRREIGIRMSLGARRGDIAALVLGQGMWAVAVGLGCGLVLAFATTRLLKSLLFGIGTLDAAAFVAGTAVLLVVALVSVALPARRAAGVDPLLCLREE